MVACDLAFDVIEPAEIVLQIVPASSAGRVLDERFDVLTDGKPPSSLTELRDPHGEKLHVVRSAAGRLTVAYRAELDAAQSPSVLRAQAPPGAAAGAGAAGAGRPPSTYEQQVYLRPSRYCPSDHLVGFAVAEFGAGPDVGARVAAVTDWIRQRIGYLPGSSSVHDSAEDTLLTAVGSCRDFAHLGVALCRATGVPARFVAVYAPGLSPMDFHAVFETFEEGRWYVHDATGLAPRPSLVRIVTGRDAADTAFAAVTSGIADHEFLEVSATVGGSLPLDDHLALVELA